MSNKYKLKSEKFIKLLYDKITKANQIINEYKKIGKVTALPSNAFINFANSMYLKGHIQEAEELLKNVTNFTHNSANAYMNLGVIKQSTGNYEDALKYYLQAYKKDRNNSKIFCLWGNCLALMGKTNEAILKYKHALDINPEDSEAYLLWGALLLKNKAYTEAKDKLALSVKYSKEDFRALYLLSVTDIETSDYDAALTKLLFITNSTVNNFEAFHNIAYVYFKKHDYDNAIKYALRTLSIFQYKVETYILLGDIFAMKNDEKESIKYYEEAEKRNLKTFFLYLSWGSSLQKFHKHEKALKKFLKAKELLKSENYIDIYTKIALSYLKTDNIELAEEYNKHALNINSNNYMANSIEAEIQMEKSNFEKAIEYALKCEDDFENKGYNYTIVAVCYKKMNDIKKAGIYFKKAIEYEPKEEEILLEYCSYLNEIKDYELIKKRIKPILDSIKNIKILELYFIALHNLAKESGYKYNIEDAINIANRIESFNNEPFKYSEEKQELERLINNSE